MLEKRDWGVIWKGGTTGESDDSGVTEFRFTRREAEGFAESLRKIGLDATVSPADVSQIGGTNQWPPADSSMISRANWQH